MERKYDAMSMNRKLDNFVDNLWTAPRSGKYLKNYSPGNGQVIGEIADSQAGDVDRAVQAATEAFQAWKKTSARERAEILNKIADGIQSRLQEFAELESLDQGKPVWLTKELDIPRAVHNFRFFAEQILKEDKENYQNEKFTGRVYRRPVGVAGLISPWNLPLYLLSWKIAPAIAYGNTVVCKPSELTSLTAGLLGQVIQEAQVPKGVINLVLVQTPVKLW